MRFAIAVGLAGLILGQAPARAAWVEASSAHFVVYADDEERDVHRFAEQLERYHAALAVVTQRNAEPPSPSNRVTVFIVRNEREVRRLHGSATPYLGGFYVPRAGGSLAIVPRVDSRDGKAGLSMIVLLHEYAHHFMYTASSLAMPRWVSEGSAEFFASASFEADGGVGLGRPAIHRAGELYFARDVRAEDLLDPASYEKRAGRSYDAFYGKSWLLYHYLTFEPEREGQLGRYLDLLGEGKAQRAAASEAFGDFDVLERELDFYLNRRRTTMISLPADLLRGGTIALRRLGEGEAAAMPLRIRSNRGVDDEQARVLAIEARALAVRFPKDAAVLSVLAEAEHDAGDDRAAIAAADAALALDPGQANAYVQKGKALFRQAPDAQDRAAAYSRALAPFLALNKREPEHPLPLIHYYRSFLLQGKQPTPTAIDGLVSAATVAPFDFAVRMELGMAMLRLGRAEDTRRALTPIAYNPHGGPQAEAARRVLARAETEPAWRGEGVERLIAEANSAADAGSGEGQGGKDQAP